MAVRNIIYLKKKHLKPSKSSSDKKSQSVRPCISMPTLISCSTNISSATELDPSVPDYAEIDIVLEERKDRRPQFANLRRTNSTSSESYTRLYPVTPSPAVPIPTSPRPIANDVSSASSRRRRPPPPPVPSLRDRSSRSRGNSASRHSYEAPGEWSYQPLEKLSGSHSSLYEDMSVNNRRMRSQTSAPGLLQQRVSLELDEVWTTYMPINMMSLEKEEEFEKPQPVSNAPPPSLPPRVPLSHPTSLTKPPPVPPSLKSPPPHPPSLVTPPPLPPSHPILSLTSSQPAPPQPSESLTTPSLLSSTPIPLSSIKSPIHHQELKVSHSVPLSTSTMTNQRPPPPPIPSGKQASTPSSKQSSSSKSSAKVMRNQSTRSMTKPDVPIKPPNLPQVSKPTQSPESSVKPSIRRTSSKPALSPRPSIIPKSRLSSPPQVNQSLSAIVPPQPKTTNSKNTS